MDDKGLIGYCRIHCETPRALFHKEDIARMLRLAGYEEAASATESQVYPDFEAVHEDEMYPLCDQALVNLRKAESKLKQQIIEENKTQLEERLFEGEDE